MREHVFAVLVVSSMWLACGCGGKVGRPAAEGEKGSRVAAQTTSDEARRDQRFQERLASGKTALEAGQLEQATDDLSEAAGLRDDPAVQALLQQVQKARKEAAAKAAKAAYDQEMLRGNQALDKQDYTEAIVAFREALDRLPNDKKAVHALQQAEKAKQKAIQAAYDQAMLLGNQALNKQDYPVAIVAFREALEHLPNDKKASAALQQAELEAVRENGRTAFKNKQYAKAVEALGKVVKRQPEDKDSRELLKQARAQLRLQFLEQGKAAMKEKRFAQAVDRFTEAKDLSPDNEVTALLAEAEFEALLARGRQRLANKEIAAAIADLEGAARLKPDDAEGRAMLHKARGDKLTAVLKERLTLTQKRFESWKKEMVELVAEQERNRDPYENVGGLIIIHPPEVTAARERLALSITRAQTQLYLWAERLLTAELELCDQKTARVAAYEAHLLRMQKAQDELKSRSVDAHEAAFRRLEAEIRLEREKARPK
jgi:tetratricopeptide (TPR) repeat protein